MNRWNIAATAALVLLLACNDTAEKVYSEKSSLRIVSLNGTITEILCATGFEKNIVGTDVTSGYPPSMEKLPKLGRGPTLRPEGILSLKPDLVLGFADEIPDNLASQLRGAGTRTLLFNREYTAAGAKRLIAEIADSLGAPDVARELNEQLDRDVAGITALARPPRVLFIYAQGTGTLLVAGRETPLDAMIMLAGGTNAAREITGFKPLTSEALLAADPEIILLFDHGLKSLKGESGVLAVPGMAETTAGKNRAFIAMEANYLGGFGPRLGKAVRELNTEFRKRMK